MTFSFFFSIFSCQQELVQVQRVHWQGRLWQGVEGARQTLEARRNVRDEGDEQGQDLDEEEREVGHE